MLNDIAIVLQHHGGQGAPQSFGLIHPADASTGQGQIANFRWTPAAGAASYTLQVSTSSAFGSFVVNRPNISRTGAMVTGLAANTTYYWRVIAKSAGGTTTSGTFSFATAAAPTYTLTFAHRDDRQNSSTGYHWKQVLIDDVVVWEADTSVDPANTWIDASVDVTSYLAGKDKAVIKLRLLDKISTGGNYSVNVWWDNVSITRADAVNGGMELYSVPWQYTEQGSYFDMAVDTSVKKNGYSSYRLFLPMNIVTAANDYAAVQSTWGLHAPDAAQGSAATWESRFNAALAALDTAGYGYAYSESADSGTLAWGTSYALEALQRMYNLTKDGGYIAKLSAYIDNMYDNLGDEDGDGYLGWGTDTYDPPDYHEYFAHTSSMVYHWANFILAVRNDPTLAASNNPQGISYAQQASELEAAIHDDLLAKWDKNWSTAYRLYLSDSPSYPGSSAPRNYYALMAKAMYKMFEVDPSRMHYLTWADDLMTLFADHVVAQGSGYKWDYWDQLLPGDSHSVYLEDWSHALPSLGAAIEAYARGHADFNDTEMLKYANTVYENLWNGSPRDPLIAQRVDGSKPHLGELTLDFAAMSMWRSELWALFETYNAANWSAPYVYGVRELGDISFVLQHHVGQAAPLSFSLSMPVNEATGTNTIQSFQWQPSENAAYYTLQVSTDPAFGSFAVNRSKLPNTGAIVSGLNWNTTYYWRVIAHSAAGTETSSVNSFTTKPAAPTYTLTFSHRDDRQNTVTNYHWKQVLVDGVVVWEEDTSVDAAGTWFDESVNITSYVTDPNKIDIKLRLYEKTPTGGNYSVNVWWDDVSLTNTDAIYGDFERPDVVWHYTETDAYFSGGYDGAIKKSGDYSYKLTIPEFTYTDLHDNNAIEIRWTGNKP